MSLAWEIYEAFKDDEAKARALAQAFDRLETAWPKAPASQEQLEHAKLELQRDIEQLRGEVQRDIEQLRNETQVMKSELQQAIAESKQSFITWIIGIMAGFAATLIAAMMILMG